MKSLSRELWSSSAKIPNAVAKIVAIIFSLCGPLKAQWVDVTPDSGVQYNQIVFVDSLRGYIAGELRISFADSAGVIFITSDGGKTWVEHKIANGGLLSVSAIGDSLVWASSGLVWRSINGGDTWQSDTVVNPQFDFLTVQFVDSLNGWVTGNYNDGFVGHDGIFRSTDGGLTWKQQYANAVDYYSYLGKGYFADTLHGWVADQYVVRLTKDGGSTWGSQGIGGSALANVYFLDTLHGWSVGDNAFVGKTEDGGASWSPIDVTPPVTGYPEFSSVSFVDTSNGWACDLSGGIIHTTNGGDTWSIQRSNTSGYLPLNSIFFLNKNNGWAVGNGIVLHTTNGGVTAVNQPLPRPKSFRLMQNYPNPFNPSTAISYQLSAVSYVSLKIYDVLGREVATLVDGKETAGLHTVTWNASKFASGVYFYRLVSSSSQGTFVQTKQMLMIK